MQDETQGQTGWYRIGKLMMKLEQFDSAHELYEVLLKRTSDQDEKALVYHQLGCIKAGQKNYAEAIDFFKKNTRNSRTISFT